MPSLFQLLWRGQAIEDKMVEAAKRGVDATTAACVTHAKSNHPWKNVSGTLEGSIQMRAAEAQGPIVRGEWGSFTVNYAIWLEIGTSRMPPYPYLRPAADAEYPGLARRIREAFG